MEKKVVNFNESKKEIDERKKATELKSFYSKMKYAKFVKVNKTNKINILSCEDFDPYVLGFVYYNCFFVLDEKNNSYKIYRICLNIVDNLSYTTQPGLYVNELENVSLNRIEDFDFHLDFIIKNIDLLHEIDNVYNKMKKENKYVFENDSTFLSNMEDEYYNEILKPISFNKAKRQIKFKKFIDKITNKTK